MATATKAAKGFKVRCVMCGDEDGIVSIDLNDVRNVTCSACDASFAPSDAVNILATRLQKWQAIAQWVESAFELMPAE